uniref:Striatin N-terminal domain-containing protein n=1 Tax=Anopheles coluzzii TaxID=1518534 RepID=A0A8W7PSG6_ANOCL
MDDNSSLGHQNGGGSAVGQLGGIGGGAGGGQGGGTGGLGDMSGGGGAGSGLVGKGGAGGGGGGMVGAGQCDDQNNKTPTQYSIPGILHFIQHEWARFELERSQWDVDRAELQVSGV